MTCNKTVLLSINRPSSIFFPSDRSTTAQSYNRTKRGLKLASLSFVTNSRKDPIELVSTALIDSCDTALDCNRCLRSNTSRKKAKMGLRSVGRATRSAFLRINRKSSKKPVKTCGQSSFVIKLTVVDSVWTVFQSSMTTGKAVFVGIFLATEPTTSFAPSCPLNACRRIAFNCLEPINVGTTSTNAVCSANACLAMEAP